MRAFLIFYLSVKHIALAHFHEWMTGSGVLYLKNKAPHISTVFTTHATTVGRSISGNGLQLYKNLHTFDGDQKSKEFNVVSKHSLEKLAAAYADSFTTVSQITAEECKQLLEREVDVITPNGFEDDFVPIPESFDKKRAAAKVRLRQVAEALFGYKLQENVKFIVTSGRYEFRNKGLDVFIDALAMANHEEENENEIVAFFMVPANNYGPRKDLLKSLETGTFTEESTNNVLTHYLHDADYDPILQKLAKNKLTNKQADKIKVIFVPVYLHGNDGIFGLNYWDLLIGMDMTVFPSYYEPWGYTPLESLAFYVPTITTTLAGFGRWIINEKDDNCSCIKVIDRNDDNYSQVAGEICDSIVNCIKKTDEEFEEIRQNSYKISRMALWKNFIENYYKSYDIALERSRRYREELYRPVPTETPLSIVTYKSNKPIWRNMEVKANTSDAFPELEELSKNLWWSWNPEAN
ncbi:MAG: hypothetical protein HC831_31455 [Chloroflexia bacterium]|nr:hypothetical protein [Chloroflexia bacterium]